MLTRMYVRLSSALASDEGATAVEYGIMASAIAAVIVVVVIAVGAAVDNMFADLNTEMATLP
jgi:pilus assembly protein Flp/PilA